MPASEVFHKYGAGKLHSGSKSGPVVKNHAQAVAIYMSEKAKEAAHGGKYPEKAGGGAAMGLGGIGGLSSAGTSGGMPMGLVQAVEDKDTLPGLAEMAFPKLIRFQNGGMPMAPPMGARPPMPQQPPVGQMGMPLGLGRGYQFGGSPSMGLTPGFIERQESRNLQRPMSQPHVGPILSTVAGRTDQHAISVPSGSYIFPADHVSYLGQGNTVNGLKVLQNMFGPSIHTPHGGMGIPHARPPAPIKLTGGQPKLPSSMTSAGGSRSDGHVGKPVPIMAAGGEFALGPDQVMKVGGGDLNRGHKILDSWVMQTRKKHIKKLSSLPPPAKS